MSTREFATNVSPLDGPAGITGNASLPNESSMNVPHERGSEDWLFQMYQQYEDWFRKLALVKGCRIHDSEDLLQELWIRIDAGRSTYDQSRDFQNWTAGILQHLLLDQVRHRTAKKRDSGRLASIEDASEIPSTLAGPESVLEKAELADQALHCLKKLSENCQKAVTLRIFEDESLDSIAELLCAKKRAIEMRIHRSIRAIRACITTNQIGSDKS